MADRAPPLRGPGGADLAPVLSCFAPEPVRHLPGTGTITGHHRGWPAVRDGVLATPGLRSGHTFRAELPDIAVGRDFDQAAQGAAAAWQRRRLDVSAGS